MFRCLMLVALAGIIGCSSYDDALERYNAETAVLESLERKLSQMEAEYDEQVAAIEHNKSIIIRGNAMLRSLNKPVDPSTLTTVEKADEQLRKIEQERSVKVPLFKGKVFEQERRVQKAREHMESLR